MVVVELAPFVAFCGECRIDDDLRALQSFLLVSPDTGEPIRGGAARRKLRWSAQGRGKREDLTKRQIEVLAELMKDAKDG